MAIPRRAMEAKLRSGGIDEWHSVSAANNSRPDHNKESIHGGRELIVANLEPRRLDNGSATQCRRAADIVHVVVVIARLERQEMR
jgi:hypothetical protein